MDLSKSRVTVRDGQRAFHRLIREYKAANPRPEGQSAKDYQQEVEAWARRNLQARLDDLSRRRYFAILKGEEIPAE